MSTNLADHRRSSPARDEVGDGAQQTHDERPLSQIVNDIWLKGATLVRQELQLGLTDVIERVDTLKSELSERVERAETRSGTRTDELYRRVEQLKTDADQRSQTLNKELFQRVEQLKTDAVERSSALSSEVHQRVEQLKLELAAKALGGAVLFAAILGLVAALILLLAQAVTPWLAALVVSLFVGAGGLWLLRRDVEPKARDHARELKSMKETTK